MRLLMCVGVLLFSCETPSGQLGIGIGMYFTSMMKSVYFKVPTSEGQCDKKRQFHHQMKVQLWLPSPCLPHEFGFIHPSFVNFTEHCAASSTFEFPRTTQSRRHDERTSNRKHNELCQNHVRIWTSCTRADEGESMWAESDSEHKFVTLIAFPWSSAAWDCRILIRVIKKKRKDLIVEDISICAATYWAPVLHIRKLPCSRGRAQFKYTERNTNPNT